jgi:hypothetical protein
MGLIACFLRDPFHGIPPFLPGTLPSAAEIAEKVVFVLRNFFHGDNVGAIQGEIMRLCCFDCHRSASGSSTRILYFIMYTTI